MMNSMFNRRENFEGSSAEWWRMDEEPKKKCLKCFGWCEVAAKLGGKRAVIRRNYKDVTG